MASPNEGATLAPIPRDGATLPPITIICAPNGARKTKAVLPNIPISPEELAAEAVRCADAGVSLFHVHVRTDEQGHSLDPDRYRAALAAIGEAAGDRMMLQVTTETVGIYEAPDMIATVKALVPESASIGIRELVPDPSYEPAARDFLHWAHGEGILIQYICYSGDEVRYFADLRTRGIVPERTRYFLLYVLGKKTGQKGAPSELAPFVEAHKAVLEDVDLHWSVCAFGEDELDCVLAAVRQGGHVRIGFENNHVMADGGTAPHNAALISQFVEAVKAAPDIDREIGNLDQLRALNQKLNPPLNA